VTLIRFNEIAPLGSTFELREIDGLNTQQDFLLKEVVEAKCTLKRKGDLKVELEGQLQVTLTLICDRCLFSYDSEIDTVFKVLFEVESESSWHVKDMEYNIPDLDTVSLAEPVIDIDDVLRQQLYLVLPMKNLCSEQCRGICTRCGANLNLAACGCVAENKESPFAILKRFSR
jgi:uncharacterized protein